MRSSRWFLLTAGAISLALLFYATWQAGRVSGGVEDEHMSLQVTHLKQTLAEKELDLRQQKQTIDSLNRGLSKNGNADALRLVEKLRKQLLKSEAEANQYKEVLRLEQEALRHNTQILDALSVPGVRLFPMHGTEAAADTTAYALVVENSHMFFVASNLPKLPQGRQYQLWLMRKQDPKIVSAGVFAPDDENRIVMDFNAASLLSGIAELEVTEEPAGGSETPTGNKLMAALTERLDRSDDY